MSDKNNDRPYDTRVKETVLNAIKDGTSILQQPREGVDYPVNLSSGTAYAGLNLLVLQQERANNNWENPHFETLTDINSKKFRCKEKSLGVPVSYWNPVARYKEDGVDANGIEHKKGQIKLDSNGNQYGEREYKTIFNLDNVDIRQHNFNHKTKEWEVASNPFAINTDYKLANPYGEAIKGIHYKASNNSAIEKFTEAASKYINSCYTGEVYEGTAFTKKEIQELQTEFSKSNSPFYKKINEANLVAVGKEDTLKKINTNVQENEQTRKSGKSR